MVILPLKRSGKRFVGYRACYGTLKIVCHDAFRNAICLGINKENETKVIV